MKEVSKAKSNRIFYISLWLIPLVFYLFFAFFDGVAWCADSSSYVEMHDCREPLYPTVLALLRFAFGTTKDIANPGADLSLFTMVILQSILAGIATASFVTFLVRQFLAEVDGGDYIYGVRMCTRDGRKKIDRLRIRYKLYAYLILLVPLAVSLLNRFAAQRASMYSNSIMTEGIVISIYMLAFRYILDYMINGSKYPFRMASFMIFIGISTRKQMYVLLCLFVIAMIYRQRKKLATVYTVVLIAGCALLFDCTYNLIQRDSFIIHTEDNRFVTTMAFYTADRNFVNYIDPELQEIYLQIYDACDHNKWLMKDAPYGWYDGVEHFADNYDHIQLDTMQLMLDDFVDYCSYSGYDDSMTKTQKIDAIRASFNRSLLPHELFRLPVVFFHNFLSGMVNTVARKNIILCIYAALIYLFFVILMIRNIYKDHAYGDSIEAEYDSHVQYLARKYKERATLSVMTMLAILGNVTLVSAVIFCQTRYAIYNMPIFYMALLLCLPGLKAIRKEL